ncbi:MAG: BlaI/MecI/CopY family transcriptional regulator [Lachnospiraceae bacterium]|nr:BlaI/MecI/CopY family transcriptional regulator [Lachnospiraceae bacterium]
MCNTLKKLGEAELEIMQVIWNNTAPLTSNYILRELQDRRKWQLSTLMTSLSRLVNKGYIICDRSMGTNLYTAIISESNYKTNAGKHFLEQLYNNSIQNMVASLYNSKMLKDSDLAELRSYLDTLENMDHGEVE